MTTQTQTPANMTAIVISSPGGPDVLKPETRPLPVPGVGEVLIKVTATGVNRPDLLQRLGKYPPPPGITDIPGLEVAGTIIALGPDTPSPFPVGARVCALLAGGGYAEYAVAPIGQILPLPDHISDTEGAALPEGLFTVWQNVFKIGQLQPHESILIHGGASGIGTLAIQMVKYKNAENIIVTAGTDAKCAACLQLGATHAVNYKTEDFVERVKTATDGRGVDVVLDMVGGDYVPRNLSCLAPHGRHVTIAMLNGAATTIDLRTVMTRQLTLTGSTLRPRSLDEKRALRDEILAQIWPGVVAGAIKPVIHARFDLCDAKSAHAALERGDHVGKIVLVV